MVSVDTVIEFYSLCVAVPAAPGSGDSMRARNTAASETSTESIDSASSVDGPCPAASAVVGRASWPLLGLGSTASERAAFLEEVAATAPNIRDIRVAEVSVGDPGF